MNRTTLILALSLAACGGTSDSDNASDDLKGKGEQSESAADKALRQAVELAKARLAQGVCESEGYTSTILDLLLEAVMLDSSLAKELPKRSALVKTVGNTLGFQIASGAIIFEEGQVLGLQQALETGVVVYTPAPGAYGNPKKITFRDNGVAGLWLQTMDEDGNVGSTEGEISYTVNNDIIELQYESGETARYRLYAGETSQDIVLLPEGKNLEETEFSERLDGLPSECEA